MIRAAELTRALGGRWCGRYGIARCVLHDDERPSLSIIEGDSGPIVTCFAGCDWREIRTKLWQRGLLNTSLARQGTADYQNSLMENRNNQERARALWQEAILLSGTIAAHYLASRKILTSATCTDGSVLRFHPSCPFDGKRYACLIALMRDIHTNEPCAIQRTALTSQGQKIERRTLGPKINKAIKLSADEDVALGLAVGEGVETVLSAIQLGFAPAWALGDADNLQRFPVVSGIECLTILVDHDANGTGQRAGIETSERWTAAGREVLRAVPNQCGYDFNNIIQ